MRICRSRDLKKELTPMLPVKGGAVALIYAVDSKLVKETVEHFARQEFSAIVLFVADRSCLVDHPLVINVARQNVRYEDAWQHSLQFFDWLSGHWVYHGFNGEFLYYPFCETRRIRDLTIFLTEERRKSLFLYTIDAYSRNLKQDETGVSLSNTGIDVFNYYATEAEPDAFPGANEDDRARMISVHGGLKWRYGEYCAQSDDSLKRPPLFLVHDELDFDSEGNTEDLEYHSYRCPWHYNPTGAVVSFRTIIDFLHNPNTRETIKDLNWAGTETFSWTSPQLLRLGFIETGQWF